MSDAPISSKKDIWIGLVLILLSFAALASGIAFKKLPIGLVAFAVLQLNGMFFFFRAFLKAGETGE